MSAPILATKLYIPPPRPSMVARPRLIGRLNEACAQGCRLTLISAPAGFGKTTLVSEWIADGGKPVAWLSLDEGDGDPARFITYLVAALQTIRAGIGKELLPALQSPQPLQIEAILTALLNDISTIPGDFLLVLDDYHALDSQPVDRALDFIIDHQPPQMHLVIATREDPDLPFARLRARGQCAELRAADLRFTPAEAAEFLNRLMGLNLPEADIAALEARTEGWIAGLQMAALSMQGVADTTGFIQSFTGSHRFVMDYLLEEVLHQQTQNIQTFLLHTSILDRVCGPLCDAVLRDPSIPGQVILEYLEHANLFIVPQDNERGWYRYHHLFMDLLRKRLGQSLNPEGIADLHIHASEWYENNDLMLDAFRHATAAKDIERAVRLMESKRMPLHRRGTATTILDWLESLPKALLDAWPSLWWKQSSMLLITGQPMEVEGKLQALEAALGQAMQPGAVPDAATRDLLGKIACARANVAQMQAQIETILVQAQRALEYLAKDSLADRSAATRALGFGYFVQGEHARAARGYADALSLAQAAGDKINTILASIRIGQIQEEDNQLHKAAETYGQVMHLIEEYSPYNAPVAYLGLARVHYQWNDLDTAEKYAEKSLKLAQQYDQVIDRWILSEIVLSHVRFARGNMAAALSKLSLAEQISIEKGNTLRLTDIAFYRAMIHLTLGNLEESEQQTHLFPMPLMEARILIARGDPSAALPLIGPQHQRAEEKGLGDRLLLVKTVEAMALFADKQKDQALQVLDEVLAQAEPEGFIRLFLDEGPRMADLLSAAAAKGIRPAYVNKLLAAFEGEPKQEGPAASMPVSSSLVEPLSLRELEVLALIAQGLSNQEICQRLFLALDTVKGHNRRIFEKLQVKRRTEAIARARELGLI